jgi:hypothetical protein
MAVADAMTERETADGYILACRAEVLGDVKVEP